MRRVTISKQQVETQLRGRTLDQHPDALDVHEYLRSGQVIYALARIRYYQPQRWWEKPLEYAFEGIAQALEDGRIGDAYDMSGMILATMLPSDDTALIDTYRRYIGAIP